MKHEEDESVFVQHEECPNCGSSDANGRYSDGHTYCFSCEHLAPPPEGWTGPTPVELTKLEDVNFLDTEVQDLTKRNLLAKTLNWYDYGFSQLGDTPVHVAPYFWQHTLVAQHTRDRQKNFKWVGLTKKLELFGQHRWRAGNKQLIITEGEIDCMTVCQVLNYRYPVVSVPNGAQSAKKYIKQNIEWIETFDKVKFCFDNDDDGAQAAKECAALLSPNKAYIVRLPAGSKDANQMVCDGLTKELINATFEAEKYRPDGVFSFAALKHRWLKRPKVSKVPFPFTKLSKMLNGCQPKRLYLWTAGSGVGKSTIVQQIASYLRKYQKRRIGVLALEESVEETIDRYISLELGVPVPHLQEFVPDETKEAAFDELNASEDFFFYDHFGSQSSESILSTIRYLVIGCGCTDIVLDHISIVVSGIDDKGNDERKIIDKLMTDLRSLVEQTGCTIHAIVHLKRPGQGKCYTEGRQVNLSDLRGSGALEQLSDAVIAVERNQQGNTPNLLWLRILKNRPTGETGVADYLSYNRDTGRLEEADPEDKAHRYSTSSAYEDEPPDATEDDGSDAF